MKILTVSITYMYLYNNMIVVFIMYLITANTFIRKTIQYSYL